MRRSTFYYPFLFASILFTKGCNTLPSFGKTLGSSFTSGASDATGAVSDATGALSILSVVGGLATLAGIAALVITKGAMGFRAIFAGIGLCLVNFVVSQYADWIFIPAIIATGIISLAFGYKTIREMLDGD
tara:strand:- start:5576 stop:5968 length:393 start_codon:yes stop_codon:yes gene_type:complete